MRGVRELRLNETMSPDRTTALNGSLTFGYSTVLLSGSQMHSFSAPIIFSTPFTYDPASGRGLVIQFFEFDSNKTAASMWIGTMMRR
jgi:hypothetical protein